MGDGSAIVSFRIEFEARPGDRNGHGRSIQIELTPAVCQSCGQDHKANVGMAIWESTDGPCTKARYTNFASAYAAAKKLFPTLP